MAKRIDATTNAQREELNKICENFIEKHNGYYNPETGELSHIDDGHCIKGDCKFRDENTATRKILLPAHLRESFKSNGKTLPEDKIGQVVICLPHFIFPHQKFYLQNGKLPDDARLLGKNENRKGQPVPKPENGYRIS
jgi:hypothetical protein